MWARGGKEWSQLGTVTVMVTVIGAMAQVSEMLNWLMEVCDEGSKNCVIRMVLIDNLSQVVRILRITGTRFLMSENGAAQKRME